MVFEAAEDWMDYSERMLRQEIEAIPDGTYRAPTGWLDDNGRDRGKPLRVECAVHVAGSDITVDLTGSEPESPTSYNAPFEGATQVAAYYIVRTILARRRDVPRPRAPERGDLQAGEGHRARWARSTTRRFRGRVRAGS